MTRRDDTEDLLNRVLSQPLSAETLAELDARVEAAVDQASARRSRWLRPRVAFALAVVVLVAPLAVVGAQTLLTESPLGLTGASEFQAEIEAAKAAVPKPPEATWPPYLSVAYSTGMYSRGGGRVAVEAVAFCLWTSEWLGDMERGDAAAAAQASKLLTGVTGWTYYRGQFATASLRDVIDHVLAGVSASDQQPARAFAANNCATN
jgi:hypothetical protein